MIKFTLGCILIALTIFFGGKELLANNNTINNRENALESQISKNKVAINEKAKYENIKSNAIIYSPEIKKNIINQLNINENKYAVTFDNIESPKKVLTKYSFNVEGYDAFSEVFILISDIEKVSGLELVDICFNCKLTSTTLVQKDKEISFKIKGNVYVYNPEK